jgi:hypothetical protein
MPSFSRSASRSTRRSSRLARTAPPARTRPCVEPFEPRLLLASIGISDVTVNEGNSGTTDAVFTVTLYQPSDQNVTVNYATSDFTATSPADFQPTSGTLTFAPGGPTTQTVTVKVAADTQQEANEQFAVNLTNPVNATVLSNANSGAGYIVDDDEALITAQNAYATEGDTGTTNLVFTVTRSGSAAGTTTVNYATQPFTATTPSDFATTSGTLQFGPGETTKTVTVSVAGDTLQEAAESFSLNLTSPVNATVVTASAVGGIIDDDASQFSIEGGFREEGDRDPAGFVFVVTRSGSLDGPASVQYATQASTAVAGQDFSAASGTLNFAPGEATKNIPIPIIPDTLQEASEQFFVNLSAADNATIAENQAQAVIVDDDAAYWVIEGGATTEGDAGTTNLEFKVRRYGQVGGAASVTYSTQNNTAAAGSDFVAANAVLNFAPLETVKTVTIPVTGDTTQENDEAFFVNLSSPSTGTLAENSAQGVIVDDDESFLTIVAADATINEGDAGTRPATFTVTRHGSLDGVTTVSYATSNGTATTPADYGVASGTLTFNPGEATKTISVDVAGDTTVEQNESFFVNLSAPVNATLAENSAHAEIMNDDGPLTTAYFLVNDVAVSEGDSGNTPATFTVRRLGDTTGADSVNYSIAAPTAGDYQVASGTLNFAAGETGKTFTINVAGDAVDETTEQYSVSLSAPGAGSQIADPAGVLTIVDDDRIVLYANDVSTQEGDDAAGHDLHFTVRRFGDTGGQTSVNYTTQNSTATSPGDFQVATGTLLFAPGEDTKDVAVRVVGDAAQENAEGFFLVLNSPVNGAITGANGQATVADDDASFVAVSDATVVEGTSAAGSTVVFRVGRFGSTDGAATVNFNTANFSATAPGDYSTTNGSVSFAPGETSKTVSIPLVADAEMENFEEFLLDLATPNNATIARGRGAARVFDDDASSVTLTPPTVVEGDTGTRDAVFTLNRYGSTAGTSSVEFRTNNFTATSPGDYTQVVQVITFAPGETTRTVAVPVVGDTTQETNEQFSGNLSGAQNTSLPSFGAALATILDDESSFLYIGNDVVIEGDPPSSASAVFTVRRFGSLKGETTVNFATAASTATAPGDFGVTSGTLTFAPGEASKTVTVPIVADILRENEELFQVNLSAANNATIVDGSGRGVIIDDDPPPTVTAVYVSGTSWGGDDGNPATKTFKEYLQSAGLGSARYGFSVGAGAGQLLTIPWTNVNQVSITFSKDVQVQKDDLSVRGTNVPNYAFAPGATGFAYDAATRTATWTFSDPLAKDRILLDLDSASPNGVRVDNGEFLDGEWFNGGDSFPSGNGIGGGDFLYRMNVLPGDVNRSNTVVADDFSEVKKRFFRSTNAPGPAGDTQYTVFHDTDGSGQIVAADFSAVKQRFFNTLPGPQPTAVASPFGANRIAAPSATDLLLE